jgi:quercetin 2,3-dioxygenase
MESKTRKIKTVIDAHEHEEGGGFIVQQPLPTHGYMQWDPFLLIHEMGPTETQGGEAKGAPDHPHRGFETVTYLLSGEMQHKDSAGNAGTLKAGDVQWMTAGRGVVHSEMPSENFQREGGRMHGFQIWVNLPAKDKMIAPRYQDVRSSQIPVVKIPGGTVKVIAGGRPSSPIQTHVPALFLDVTLEPGAVFSKPVPDGWNALAYVFEGGAKFSGESLVGKRQMALFSLAGTIDAVAGDQGARFIILAGTPLNEPVARFGPFVMNTRKELEQAFLDFQSGQMGKIS